MVWEILDEPPVEIGEAEERLHLFLVLGFGPVCDTCNLDWVHFRLAFGDDQADASWFFTTTIWPWEFVPPALCRPYTT
jgi:hypothetical protein